MQDAQRYIDNVKRFACRHFKSRMSKVSPNDLPIISISATSNLSETEFYQKMKDDFLPQIQQLKGVAEITLLGGEEREIQVKVNQEKLVYYKISLSQVVDAINRSGLDLPAGKVQSQKENNSVRITGKFTTIEDIMNVQVAMPMPNSPVYVKDIANVIDGVKEVASVSRYNGANGIGLMLKNKAMPMLLRFQNWCKKLKQIEAQNTNADVKFTIADDSTDKTIAAVNSVVFDLFWLCTCFYHVLCSEKLPQLIVLVSMQLRSLQLLL